jgi:hypothetical protein
VATASTTPILYGKIQHNNDMVQKQATQQQHSEAKAEPHKYSVAILHSNAPLLGGNRQKNNIVQ